MWSELYCRRWARAGWDFYSSLAVSDKAKDSGMQIVSGFILSQTKVEVCWTRNAGTRIRMFCITRVFIDLRFFWNKIRMIMKKICIIWEQSVYTSGNCMVNKSNHPWNCRNEFLSRILCLAKRKSSHFSIKKHWIISYIMIQSSFLKEINIHIVLTWPGAPNLLMQSIL